jgi:hypothetical protein
MEKPTRGPFVTPAPPTGPASGATNLTVKQQRAAARAKKLERYQREQKRAVRNRRIGIASVTVVAVAIVALVVTSVVLTPQKVQYSAGGDGTEISGVETFNNAAGHVQTPVTYAQNPPAGGEHHPTWLNCGVYTEPVPNENAVHSLEHGAIWVTYDPSLSETEIDKLKMKLPSTHAILSPLEGLPSSVVLSGWNVQLQADNADDERISAFMEEYWKSQNVPEPGASCTGAYDAPGKVS